MALSVYRALGSALCTAFLTGSCVVSCSVYLEQGEGRGKGRASHGAGAGGGRDLRALTRQQEIVTTAACDLKS